MEEENTQKDERKLERINENTELLLEPPRAAEALYREQVRSAHVS